MSKTKDQLAVVPPAGYSLPLASALWRMIDSRERTLAAVKDVEPAELDWQASGLQNRIGTLLYHIAAVETDWLYTEVLQQPWPDEVTALFPYDMRTAEGQLSPVLHVSLNDHLARLETTRTVLLNNLKTMTEQEFYRLRDLPDYQVSPEWVLQHLAQHEDEHRGEITTIRTLYQAAVS